MPKAPRPIDWEAVWKSLNWDDEKRQQAAERERLRQRADSYASPSKEAETHPDNVQLLLSFDLGGERYGLDVMQVRGVRPLGKLTPVPGAPGFYPGVVNLRGQIVTVMDLRLFFGLTEGEEVIVPDELVIAQAGRLQLALLAHQVNGVVPLAASAIKPVEAGPYTLGLTKERMIVLDLNRLFEDERLIIGGATS